MRAAAIAGDVPELVAQLLMPVDIGVHIRLASLMMASCGVHWWKRPNSDGQVRRYSRYPNREREMSYLKAGGTGDTAAPSDARFAVLVKLANPARGVQ